MRLICPNCDAQYEVDDAAIPEAGRDVQCSNCGHAWFQMPPDQEAEQEAEDALFGSVMGGVVAKPTAAPAQTAAQSAPPQREQTASVARPAPVIPQPAPPVDASEAVANAPPPASDTPKFRPKEPTLQQATVPPASPPPPEEPTPEAVPQPGPPRRGLDENLLAVLREEAERETAARRSETPRPLESQPDLGLEETRGAGNTVKAVRDRLARLRGDVAEPEPEVTERPTARRDLLPDIEEINSTLRASTEDRSGDAVIMAQDAMQPKAQRNGFRSGFSLMLLVAVVLIAAYLAAPKITQQFPATKGAMDSYVSGVNNGRVWLDGAMRSAISALQNLTGKPES
ncbi:zinc-ribbon domain-containing protein [Pseudorhodobacter sp.]|uniref:zinc-ribbon domain-containing protein n=1 Tax=Pseudorhodobacter sp. TaxID=1934400 RepID=UPI0026497DB7|nr:zinc-ribbon domain-containing protein [Pseudorhodobacter sp.]MDN5787868.1 zinc-ribbon domain-containing protein [Pseudorhodobacter sp.]